MSLTPCPARTKTAATKLYQTNEKSPASAGLFALSTQYKAAAQEPKAPYRRRTNTVPPKVSSVPGARYPYGMPLTSQITTYDAAWPFLFEQEMARLAPVFGRSCVAIHHVGSTAVEGMVAKPEIDILVVVSGMNGLSDWHGRLRTFGCRRGGDLMSGHLFFKRDVAEVRTHKLHLRGSDHTQIHRMLGIRDHLRADPEDRAAYAALKLRLQRDNQAGISEYLAGKAPFLDDMYRRWQALR